MRGLSCLCHIAYLPVPVRSAPGTCKEEQGQKTEEEPARCLGSILVDSFRSLISRVDKSRNHSMGLCALCMHTYTYTCQAMSVVMLPRRKHDVLLPDKQGFIL